MIPVPSTDGVVVALHDLGGTGRPVLFAHATGFCGRMWAPVVAHLPGWRAWAPDVRAHGDALIAPETPLGWAAVARDLLAVVDHVGLVDVVAVGHSMGAASLLLAETARPGTFAALYCYEPVTPPTDPPIPAVRAYERVIEAASLRRRDVFPSRRAALENFAGKPPFDRLDPAALRAYVDHGFADVGDGSGAVRLKCRPTWEAALYVEGARHGAFERLGEVRCPVTVATGEATEGRPSSYAAQVAERLKDAGIRVEVDRSRDRMQAKIRNAQLQKVPYMLVIGGREAEAGAVAVRLRSGEDLGAMPIDDFLKLVQPVVETKSLDLQQPRETTT
jgi:pimeloyl-ACP methyl ester carboxylesterase